MRQFSVNGFSLLAMDTSYLESTVAFFMVDNPTAIAVLSLNATQHTISVPTYIHQGDFHDAYV